MKKLLKNYTKEELINSFEKSFHKNPLKFMKATEKFLPVDLPDK